jgi:hypothetical protein
MVQIVIPAKAGIHKKQTLRQFLIWMPAFAGMTVLAYFSGSATPSFAGMTFYFNPRESASSVFNS